MKTIKKETRTGKLTLNQVFKILDIISLKECTIDEIIKELKIDVSCDTIRNVLKNTKHRYGQNKKKPLLNNTQKNKRVELCKLNYFLNVYLIEFSDEMTIWKDKNSRKCWYKIGKQKVSHITRHSKKFNVWGMINSDGELYYNIFSENMDSNLYDDILFSNMLPLHKDGYYFQQDNHTSHTTKNIKKFFEDYDINVLP